MKLILCPYGILGKRKCRKCYNEYANEYYHRRQKQKKRLKEILSVLDDIEKSSHDTKRSDQP